MFNCFYFLLYFHGLFVQLLRTSVWENLAYSTRWLTKQRTRMRHLHKPNNFILKNHMATKNRVQRRSNLLWDNFAWASYSATCPIVASFPGLAGRPWPALWSTSERAIELAAMFCRPSRRRSCGT